MPPPAARPRITIEGLDIIASLLTCNLTMREIQVLCALRIGPLGTREISQKIHCSRGPVNLAMAGLTMRGMVALCPDPHDLRRPLYRLLHDAINPN